MSSFLTAHQHILGHSVPYDGVKDRYTDIASAGGGNIQVVFACWQR